MTNLGSGGIDAPEDMGAGPPRAATWPRSSDLEQERHGAVVDQLDVHVRAEDAARGAEAGAEAFVQRLGQRRRGSGDVGRPVALPGVAVERELADDEHLAVAEGLVHPAV